VNGGGGATVAGLVLAAACLGFAVGQRVALHAVRESSASVARELAELKRTVEEERSTPQCEAPQVDVAAVARAVALEISQTAAPPAAAARFEVDAGAARRAGDDVSPESARAFADGDSLVDAAVRSGTWTASDAQRLRELKMHMTGPQREELTQKIVMAINAGTITTNFRGGLF
jgi:hypothetical protein